MQYLDNKTMFVLCLILIAIGALMAYQRKESKKKNDAMYDAMSYQEAGLFEKERPPMFGYTGVVQIVEWWSDGEDSRFTN